MNAKKLIEIRNELGYTQTELAKFIGRVSMRTVQNWEYGKSKIPDYVEPLLKNELLRINAKNGADNNPVDSVTPVPFDNYMMVEYADLSTAAGPLGGNKIEDLPESKTRLVPKEFDNGEYLVTRVDGDSMDNGTNYSIPDGAEILIKKYYLNNGDKLPIRNNLFVINAKEGKALKQIIEHNVEEGFIICHSYNSDFKDYKIYMEDIIEIFLYRKIVSLRPPIPDIKN